MIVRPDADIRTYLVHAPLVIFLHTQTYNRAPGLLHRLLLAGNPHTVVEARCGVVHDMMARASQPPLHTVSEQLKGEPCQHPGTIATACAHSHTDRRGGQHVTDGMGDLGYPMSLCVSENPSCLFDTDEEVQYVLYEIRISYVQVVRMSTPPSQESRTARDISRPFRPLLYLLYVSLPRLDSPYPSVRASMR